MRVELLAITRDAEKVIEKAGRTCYHSGSKTRVGSEKHFIHKIIKNGHRSVLEHAYATFRITGVSRSFTHQLVRHRLCAFSQRSQRCVNEENFAFVEPESIAGNLEAHSVFIRFMKEAQAAYEKLGQLNIIRQDRRFVLPNAVQSEIVMSANFRELRHIFCVRCDKRAQWEIRNVALEMLRIIKKEAPAVFGDFAINEESKIAYTPFRS